MSRHRWLLVLGLSVLVLTVLWTSSLITGAPSAQVSATQQTQTSNQGLGSLLSPLATSTPSADDLTATVDILATQFAQGNAITTLVAAQHPIKNGVFDAYFLTVPDGAGAQMTTVRQALTTRYGWTITDVPVEQIVGANSPLHPNDPDVNGQVVVIPGGSGALSAAELKAIEDYVAQGGNLVIFAGTNLNDNQTSLATSDNLNKWLDKSFGMRFDQDVVLDPSQAYQSPLVPVTTDVDGSHFITTNGVPSGQAALVFEEPNSITIAAAAPTNVTVTALTRTTAASYSKTDLQAVLNNKTDKTTGDLNGPFVLAAAAENTQTHARIVLFGSTSLGSDTYAQFSNIDNLSVAFNSIIWVSDYRDYFNRYVVPQNNAIATAVQQTLTAPTATATTSALSLPSLHDIDQTATALTTVQPLPTAIPSTATPISSP